MQHEWFQPSERPELEHAIAMIRELDETDPLRRAARARSVLGDPELAAAALSQASLRHRATEKFGDLADELLYTTDGLEQSSRREVADHRAQRYAAAGIGAVLDLCCGIGGDAMAFGRAGLTVRAVELDPATAAIATANLASRRAAETGTSEHPMATVELAAAEDSDWRSAESVFIDPARRGTRGRTFDPAAYSPSFDFVLTLLADCDLAAAKLGPGIEHALVPAEAEAEWVSFRSGVKEAVLWSAGFARASGTPVRRRATVLPSGASVTDAEPEEIRIGPIGRYLLEPDGAVIRAGLVRQAAAALGGWRLDAQLAYLSADRPADTPLARCYRVLDVMPFSVKRLRAELHRRQVGIVEIKKRGVPIDPAQLRRELKPTGPNSLTVALARVGSNHVAILAHPVARTTA